jgi:hypothetical protein
MSSSGVDAGRGVHMKSKPVHETTRIRAHPRGPCRSTRSNAMSLRVRLRSCWDDSFSLESKAPISSFLLNTESSFENISVNHDNYRSSVILLRLMPHCSRVYRSWRAFIPWSLVIFSKISPAGFILSHTIDKFTAQHSILSVTDIKSIFSVTPKTRIMRPIFSVWFPFFSYCFCFITGYQNFFRSRVYLKQFFIDQ